MPAIFVTATGTDIGKTFVTQGLIRELRRTGCSVQALKPVVSGFDPATPETSDPGVLLAALGRPVNGAELDRISPWRFKAPLSPDLAARREERTLDFDAVVAFSRAALLAGPGMLLIEGVGGIMTPLTDERLVLDWMASLRLPILLVAGSYLGTISHTLSAVDVLVRRGLCLATLVVSETRGSGVTLDDTVETIARHARPLPVIALPRLPEPEPEHEAFRRLGRLFAELGTRPID